MYFEAGWRKHKRKKIKKMRKMPKLVQFFVFIFEVAKHITDKMAINRLRILS